MLEERIISLEDKINKERPIDDARFRVKFQNIFYKFY